MTKILKQLPAVEQASLIVLLFALAIISFPATAQTTLSVNVQNGLEPEEVFISTRQSASSTVLAANPAGGAAANYLSANAYSNGSFSYTSQYGNENYISTYINDSSYSAIGVLQVGDSNRAQAVITESPGSAIAQYQYGNQNVSDVAIVGGSQNTVATAQLGNNLSISFGLVDSTNTSVVYGQAGENYGGSLVIRNAPSGTSITLK